MSHCLRALRVTFAVVGTLMTINKAIEAIVIAVVGIAKGALAIAIAITKWRLRSWNTIATKWRLRSCITIATKRRSWRGTAIAISIANKERSRRSIAITTLCSSFLWWQSWW